MDEIALGALLCGLLGGAEAEVKLDFQNQAQPAYNRVDCLTPDYAFEFGFDKRTSRDSVHQAVFAAEMSNTEPFVVLIDTDGVEGKFEQEMRIVTNALGIRYARCSEDLIVRWAKTTPFRSAGLDKSLDDLPRNAAFSAECRIGEREFE